MNVSPAKEAILKKIREALSNSVPLPFPAADGKQDVFLPEPPDLDVKFAEEFIRLFGQFAFCASEAEAYQQLHFLIKKRGWTNLFIDPSLLKFFPEQQPGEVLSCDVAITPCHYLVARTGAIVVSSAMPMGRIASVYAPVHICVAYSDQLVYDTAHAISKLKEEFGDKLPSSISFIAGPSRTADIEKTLVTGVHGPGEVFVFLIDNSLTPTSS